MPGPNSIEFVRNKGVEARAGHQREQLPVGPANINFPRATLRDHIPQSSASAWQAKKPGQQVFGPEGEHSQWNVRVPIDDINHRPVSTSGHNGHQVLS